jgi:2-dehydro-3-deoxygluconokinase
MTPRYDVVALGEVMLRLDPGDVPVRAARHFRAWEGGGEYNVARAAAKVFRRPAAILTALVDNEVGRLVEDLMWQGGVDTRHVRWMPFDGLGRAHRNGLNFTERGFGPRAARGCSDRGHTAVSQLQPDDLDLDAVFARDGARWLHTGGVFTGLGPATPEVALQAIHAARANGARISYDLNYRASLWADYGGSERAQQVNRAIAAHVDVLIGNEEDFHAALGFQIPGTDEDYEQLPVESFSAMIAQVIDTYPHLTAVATTLRAVRSASRNDWGALLWMDGTLHQATPRPDLEIYDRVGGGDGFASGLIHALLDGRTPQDAVDLGAAHGALAMSTPGDTSMALAAEVHRLAGGGGARVIR